MKFLARSGPFFLWAITGFLIALSLDYYFILQDSNSANFFLQLSVLMATLAITVKTLREASSSTHKTVKTFAKMIKKSEETTEVLNQISKSMETIADDVRKKADLSANLTIKFGPNRDTLLDVNSGKECELQLIMSNHGPLNAMHPSWTILFPPEIKIVDSGVFSKTTQGPGTRHHGFVALNYKLDTQSVAHFRKTIKLTTEAAYIGKKKVFFSTSCDNERKKDGELTLNFVG